MKKMMSTLLILAMVSTTAWAADPATTRDKTRKGAVIGGVAGAIAGAIIHNNRGSGNAKRGERISPGGACPRAQQASAVFCDRDSAARSNRAPIAGGTPSAPFASCLLAGVLQQHGWSAFRTPFVAESLRDRHRRRAAHE